MHFGVDIKLLFFGNSKCATLTSYAECYFLRTMSSTSRVVGNMDGRMGGIVIKGVGGFVIRMVGGIAIKRVGGKTGSGCYGGC